MTKDVLLSISGLHYDMSGNVDDYEDNEENEPIEMITPAAYYLKNGKHYVLYDEVVEGIPGVIKNKVRITGEEKLEIIKSGLTNTHMIFEKDRIHMTEYETPYGELMMGVHTKEIHVDVAESLIEVRVNYALDINSEPVADCNISLNIKALEH